jgi:translation elongation factor EF-4
MLIFTTAILTITGNITEKDRKKGQVLDTLKVERERGEM